MKLLYKNQNVVCPSVRDAFYIGLQRVWAHSTRKNTLITMRAIVKHENACTWHTRAHNDGTNNTNNTNILKNVPILKTAAMVWGSAGMMKTHKNTPKKSTFMAHTGYITTVHDAPPRFSFFIVMSNNDVSGLIRLAHLH